MVGVPISTQSNIGIGKNSSYIFFFLNYKQEKGVLLSIELLFFYLLETGMGLEGLSCPCPVTL